MPIAECPSLEDLEAWAAGRGTPADLQRVDDHVAVCSACLERLDAQAVGSGFLDHARTALKDPESRVDSATCPTIPGFEICREIGRGGMGVVYEATQTALNRTVALKVLPSVVATLSATAAARFRDEATAAAGLRHDHIVSVFDFGTCEGAYYYAMELIDGMSLRDVISRGAGASKRDDTETQTAVSPSDQSARSGQPCIPPADGVHEGDVIADAIVSNASAYYHRVAGWVRDAADALHFAHERGIIHRDIKPGNLILARNGRLMVVDFGLAKRTDAPSITLSGSPIGTPRYMSPEQTLAGTAPVDCRTDVYSLGVTMYELLTLVPAIAGGNDSDVIANVRDAEPTRPRKIRRSIPPELETICLKAMEKVPGARYPTAAALAEDIRRHLGGLPIMAKPSGPAERLWKCIKRYRAAVVLVLTLSTAAACAFLLWNSIGQTKRVVDQATVEHCNHLAETGNNLIRVGDWGGAEAAFREAMALCPDDALAPAELARMMKEQYNSLQDKEPALLEEAIRLCETALSLDLQKGERDDVLNTKGVALKKLGRYDAAIETYKLAADLDQTNPDPIINLGTVSALKHDLDAALSWYDQAERMLAERSAQPVPAYRCVGLHHNIGAVLLLRGDVSAGEHLRLAESCASEHAATLVLLARYCLTLGDRQNHAVDYANRADVFAGSQSATAKRMHALACLREGDYDRAIRQARLALGLEDVAAFDHLILTIAHARLGDYGAASAELAQAEAAWPSWAGEPDADDGHAAFTADAPAGFLWFELAAELRALHAEAEALARTARP